MQNESLRKQSKTSTRSLFYLGPFVRSSVGETVDQAADRGYSDMEAHSLTRQCMRKYSIDASIRRSVEPTIS
jgi:hypothetical protein